MFRAATEAVQRLGYSAMKPEQLQVVSGVISGRDVFAIYAIYVFGEVQHALKRWCSDYACLLTLLPRRKQGIAMTWLLRAVSDDTGLPLCVGVIGARSYANRLRNVLHSTAHNCIPRGQVDVLDLT